MATADPPPSLAAALAQLQKNLPHIGKKAEAQYGKYADLSDVSRQVLPKLGELGLSFIARPTLNENGDFVLLWSLLHVSGEHESGQYPLPGMDKGPQALGSAITYARRYALCAVTGAAPDDDDDDGGEAERQHEEPQPSRGAANGHTSRAPMHPAQKIAMHLKRLGVTDDAERLVKVSLLAERTEPIASSKELSDETLHRIVDELAACRNRAALDALLRSKATAS